MFFIIEKSGETTFEFSQNVVTVIWFWLRIKTETQKIVNLLGDANNEYSKFATIKRYVIDDQNNTDCGEENGVSTTVKFETKVIKSNLCDYSDAYILVTGNITATGGDANTRVAFKNCVPFTKCITHINDEHVDNADNLDIIMPMYTFIEHSNNSDTSGSLCQLKETSKIWTMETLLIFFYKRTCGLTVWSFVGVPVGIASASFTLIFSLITGIIRKLLSITRNKKKHDKILMTAKNKLDSIETLVPQALINMEISHKELNAIIREKQKYERMKKIEKCKWAQLC